MRVWVSPEFFAFKFLQTSTGIKRDFSFMDYEFSRSVFLIFPRLVCLSCSETSNKITSERSTRHLKVDNALFEITNRCLLVKTFKMLRIPCML